MIKSMPWLHSAIEDFHQRMLNQRLPHALLLQGREGDGAQVLANTLAQASLCFSPELGYPCGQCKSCLLCQAETHPDLLMLEPGGASESIRVDEIRTLVERFSTTAQISSRKTAVIQHAESMNISAANALLKTLEEPPGNALLILISEGTKPLLPTVRSRCQSMVMEPPTKEQALEWLATTGIAESLSEQMTKALGYQPLRIAKWIEEGLDKLWSRFDVILSGVADIKITPVAAASECKEIALRDQLDWVELKISSWVRQRAKTNEKPETHWLKYMDQITALRHQLLQGVNLNAQLFSENLFMLWYQFNRELKAI